MSQYKYPELLWIGAVSQSTGAVKMLDYAHHEIHAGSHFTTHAEATLASDATLSISITTPNTTKWAHMVVRARSSGEANIDFLEASTYSAGSALTAQNRNRNSANTTTLTAIVKDATNDDTGSSFYMEHFGSGQVVGGTSRGDQEWVLKQNTKYSFLLTSEANSNDCEIILDWYEQQDKDL
jgi:hypothetical protein